MISIRNLSYHIAGRTLLNDVNLTLPAKHRFGFVGRNGTGKTTLFRLLLKEMTADTGTIDLPKQINILSIGQDTPQSDLNVLDFLLSTHKVRAALMHKLENCQAPEELAAIYEQLEAIDAFSAESKAAKILKGLGFSDKDQQRPLHTFSGGYRKRVALAAALFQEPDVLLLDEPTNHLDFEAVLWLRKFLKTYPKTLLLISHDRSLLNDVAQSIIHLHHKKLKCYKGNYDQFEQNFALQKMALAAYNKKVEAQKAHWQKFVDRFKAKPSKAAQAQSRIKAMQKLSTVMVPEDDPSLRFYFPEPAPLPSPFLSYDHLDLGYRSPSADNNHQDQTHLVLKNLSGRLNKDDRIALLGQNGNGKSTFAKFLAGLLQPLTPHQANVTRLSKLRVGYFHQHQLEALNADQTPLQHMHDLGYKGNETQWRTHLGNFALSDQKALTPVGNLSGGEKARLAFALICTAAPHFLILDEPTNHLDMDMQHSLINAVNRFNGAVVVVSHDWHFLENTVDQLWLVAQQKVAPFNGTLKDYQKAVA